MDTAQRLRAIDKKARRQANHKARKDGLGIEGVINTLTTQLREVKERPLDMARLDKEARRDMGQRIKLGDMAREGNVGAAKRRRQLNDWELSTAPAGASDAWNPDGKRAAVGRCDVDGVESSNKAKRGY